jgi:two-component system, chemotaxis family, protein-glutamate methylesterase/glutaminase
MPPAAIRPAEPIASPRTVLIVDDSAVARAMIGRAVSAHSGFTVVGLVPDAKAALAFLHERHVDIVLLDIDMPGTDGLTALPDLIAAGEGAKILIVSSTAGEGAAVTIHALALGAADTLQKPETGNIGRRFASMLTEKLERLVADEPVAAHAGLESARSPLSDSVPYDIVAIGASTGGIHALSRLLRLVPPSCTLPFLVTQHLPISFMPYFATQLAVLGGRPCEVATDRLRIRAGRMIVAPGDAHMRVVRLSDGSAAIRLSRQPAPSGCMPSVDPMLESVAQVFGSRSLAIVLSGMGRDGAIGAERVAAAGGSVVVQDQASSVVWGMPGAVARTGCAHAILSPDQIGRLIGQQRRPA